jgi:hypothetical protein
MIKNIHLLHELQKENTAFTSENILFEAKHILQEETAKDKALFGRLKGTEKFGDLSIDGIIALENENIFNVKSIRTICTKYRLRFLDSSMFKAEIPYEAIVKIKQIEKQSGLSFRNFKIIAPASRFSLKDSTKDPLLFAQLSDNTYYFIHQWGNDLSWYNKLFLYPISSLNNLAVSILVFSLLTIILIPTDILPAFYQRTVALGLLAKGFIFFALSGFIFTLVLIAGLITNKDFSENVWNNKYFN